MKDIKELEMSTPPDRVAELRKTHKLPSLDGAPQPWLDRYADALRSERPKPVHDIDAWWREQASRRPPNRWQVWSGKRRPAILEHSADTEARAAEFARDMAAASKRRVWVYEAGVVDKYKLTIMMDGGERGPWAKPKPPPAGWIKLQAEALALMSAPDGSKLSDIGVTPKRAFDIIEMIGFGTLRWGKSRRKDVKRMDISLEKIRGAYIVRRKE